MVTAVITTYKRTEEIVKRALVSVINQTYEDVEILLVDDNREDSEGVAYSNALLGLSGLDDRIQIIKTEAGKHGAQAARNTGIHNAKGEYVAFLDDDDEWLPRKLEMQVALMEKRPDAGLCFCMGNKINEDYNPPRITDFHGGEFYEEVSYKRLLQGDCIGTTTQAMIRKTAFDVVGDFDEKFPARQDYEMWVRISSKFSAVGVAERLFNNYKGNSREQISRNWDKCIEGHSLLYEKYRADIDKDRRARFNVVFLLAHYYRMKGDNIKGIGYYIKAFFISPLGFFRMGKIKLEQLTGRN